MACRSCGADVLWVPTLAGKRMPLNASPDPMGNVVLRKLPTGETFAHVLRKDEATDERRFMPHHATCPSAAQHRRR